MTWIENNFHQPADLGRAGVPDEIASITVYLASRRNGYVTAPTSTSTADRTSSDRRRARGRLGRTAEHEGDHMEIDQLVDTACERAGSDDLGDDTWREGLEVLVRSLDTEAALNEMGVGAMTDQIVGYLVNRLEVEQWYARHPEIDEQEIVAPLFGLGLPAHRVDRAELPARPGPVAAVAAHLGGIHAVPATRDRDRAHRSPHRRGPGRHRLHQRDVPRTSRACCRPPRPVPRSACCSWRSTSGRRSSRAMALIPSYSSWLLQCDMEPAYRYHRRVLKLLQWRCPPERWWLKTPVAHALDRRARRGVPRRPVRHDPPRRRQGAAVGVRAVRHAVAASSPNAPIPSPSGPRTSRSGGSRSSG